MAQWVKNLPSMQEMQETQVQSLGQENSLEGEMTTHSSILAGKFQGQRKHIQPYYNQIYYIAI